jgi:hypothetical protein
MATRNKETGCQCKNRRSAMLYKQRPPFLWMLPVRNASPNPKTEPNPNNAIRDQHAMPDPCCDKKGKYRGLWPRKMKARKKGS